jgi:N-acetylglutamate synthase-like GNAT family acetyltransferase
VGGLRSKSWDEFAAPGAPSMDFVFTVCDAAAGEACPAWPGHPITAHWGVEDPAAVTGTDDERRRAFRKAATALRRRIELFLSLPVETLDRVALKRELDEIGRAPEGEPATAAEVRLGPAGPADVDAARRLLEASDLPAADLDGVELLVARSGGRVVGCVGAELHGPTALLRSLAVDPRRRGEGIGEALLRAVVDLARRRGALELYALTTTIEPLLARRGFTRVPRAEVPAAVRRSAEFATLCPASAACMKLEGDLRPRAA